MDIGFSGLIVNPATGEVQFRHQFHYEWLVRSVGGRRTQMSRPAIVEPAPADPDLLPNSRQLATDVRAGLTAYESVNPTASHMSNPCCTGIRDVQVLESTTASERLKTTYPICDPNGTL